MKTNNIEINGQYLYINDHCIKFQSEAEARAFLLDLIIRGGCE